MKCSMDTDKEHGHGQAAWTWTSSIDMYKQHRHVQAAWTWTGSMEKDMGVQHADGQTHSMDMDIKHGHGDRD